ncbi:MAG: hypothetical protein OEZ36_08555, partial [Spirochaetota bacterium]|nr:hypothetical protein [Spirochaetota bacterium]
KMIYFFLWLSVLIVLVIPPVDKYLDANMSRHMLIQIPFLLVLGYLSGHRLRHKLISSNQRGLPGFIFFVGTMIFWMIPRSLDEAALSSLVDNMMHFNMLLAGFALGHSASRLTFPLKGALAIYGLSMIISMGFAYSNYNSLICAAYNLEQQRELGGYLLYLSPVLFIALIIWVGYHLTVKQRDKTAM